MHLRFLLYLITLLCPVLVNAQSGWTRPKNGLFAKADLSLLSARNYYNPLGDMLVTNRFQQVNLGLYAEYGLSDRLNLLGQATVLRMNKYATTRPVFGQGDLQLHLKYRFTSNRLPVSASAGLEVPTGRANAYASDKEIPGVQINLPTGDGEFNFWFTLAASRSFGKFYASLFASYDHRTRYNGLPFRDLYQAGAELGYHPVERLWLCLKTRSQLSHGRSEHPELGFVRGDGSTFSMYFAEAFFKPGENWGYSLSLSAPAAFPVKFVNVYAAPMISLGISFQK